MTYPDKPLFDREFQQPPNFVQGSVRPDLASLGAVEPTKAEQNYYGEYVPNASDISLEDRMSTLSPNSIFYARDHDDPSRYVYIPGVEDR